MPFCAGLLEIGHALLAAGVEGGVGDVGARRHRALHHIEARLEGGILDRLGELELRVLRGLADLEHGELVGVEGDRALRPGEAEAEEVRPGASCRR